VPVTVPILPGAADPLVGPAVQGPPPRAAALAPHHVAVDVRPSAFVDHYFTIVAAYGV
jgi:hypothetical protein